MRTVTNIEHLFSEDIRHLREQSRSGKRQARSYVDSAVANTFTRVTRAYIDGLSFCVFHYSTTYDAHRSHETIEEIKQKLADLFGNENIQVCLDESISPGIMISVGF